MRKCVKLVRKALNEHRRLADEELEVICAEILHKYGIFSCINNINFNYERDTSNNRILALYSYGKDCIVFNMPLFNEFVFSDYQLFQKREGKGLLSFNEFYVWKQLETVFHEVRHVIQYCKFSKKHVILQYIVLNSFLFKDQEKYFQNYHLFPIEKDADIFAYKNVLNVFKESEHFNAHILKFFYADFMINLLKGYNLNQEMESTLEEFFKKVLFDENGYNDCHILANQLSLLDKMSFNFPLDNNDIAQIREALDNVKEGKDPNFILMKKMKSKKA